jgi:Protein of unknown function (DUF2934)
MILDTVMDSPNQSVPEPTDEEIALGAYRLWLQEGSPNGRDWEHWLKSRQQLIAAKMKEKAEAGNPSSAQ